MPIATEMKFIGPWPKDFSEFICNFWTYLVHKKWVQAVITNRYSKFISTLQKGCYKGKSLHVLLRWYGCNNCNNNYKCVL